MLFSVLLPTHDRLKYLRYAIDSVLRQDDQDWEIVVSDNDSTDDIAAYVEGLRDERIRYVRTDCFVPVTENWNNALRESSGDYVVMLGDDDALLPGYLSSLRKVIDRFSTPDAGYTPARTCTVSGRTSGCAGRLSASAPARSVLRRRRQTVPARQAASALARRGGDRLPRALRLQHAIRRRQPRRDRTAARRRRVSAPPFLDYRDEPRVRRVHPDCRRPAAAGRDPGSPADLIDTPTSTARNRTHVRCCTPTRSTPRSGLPSRTSCCPEPTSTLRGCFAMEALYRRLGGPGDLQPNYGHYRSSPGDLLRAGVPLASHDRSLGSAPGRGGAAVGAARAVACRRGRSPARSCGSRRGRCAGPAGHSSTGSLASTESRESCPTARSLPRHQ